MIFSIEQFLQTSTQLPPYLIPWVRSQFSLTDQLCAISGDASLEILQEGWRLTSWWDQQVLNLDHQVIFQREIIMKSHHIPCWYARTIIPELTYRSGESLFKRLKTESLGAIIFNEPSIQRVQLIDYPLGHDSIEYHWLKPAWRSEDKPVWSRLSTLMMKTHPFYLVEILLPGLERYST